MVIESYSAKMVVFVLTCSLFLIPCSLIQAAPAPVPKEALKALQIAKGKPCSTGVVFMDGKYIPPPYVVKRYGTAIMINDVQVTSPLVPWEEFIKTQSGVKVSRSEAPAAAEEPEAEIEEEEEAADEDDPLADLFDDEPKPAKKAAPKKKRAKKPPKPAVTTTYSLEGEFVMNDASKKLEEKINRYRTDVNARLIKGGFIFFGSNYSRVSGEARETKRLLTVLPGLMRTASSGSQLFGELRANGFSYLTEQIADDLVRNKYLWPLLDERGRKMNEEAQLNSLIKSSF